MTHRLSLFASHPLRPPAAPAQAATPVLIDILPAKWPVDPVPAPATGITYDRYVIPPARAVLKFEVKRT